MEMAERRSGWVTFAAILVLLAGGFNIVWGYGALDKKELFVEGRLIYSNLNFWGWFFIIVGAAQVLTAFLLFARKFGGVILAGVGASLSAMIAFISLLSNSDWALAIIILDILVLWGVFAHL